MTDAEQDLVRHARTGDRAAFEELVRRTSRLVFARLYLETGDVHRAEDLTQETFMSAYRAIQGLANEAGFRGWLLRIAQNVALDAARRDQRRKRKAAPVVLEETVAKTGAPGDELERVELREQVLAALRSLPEEYRLPLSLRYLAGADYETICEQMGLTNGSLRGLLHRGLKLLRSRLPAELAESAGTSRD